MDENEQKLKERIQKLEHTLRNAHLGFDLIHRAGLNGFTEELVLHCVHQKGVIDRVLKDG